MPGATASLVVPATTVGVPATMVGAGFGAGFRLVPVVLEDVVLLHAQKL